MGCTATTLFLAPLIQMNTNAFIALRIAQQ
jgi:hypothetical protein